MDNKKFILDACCGGRCFWFDKSNPHVLFIDNRQANKGHIGHGYNPNHEVKPDLIMDFRHLNLEDNTFNLVVFDPPHLFNQKESSIMGKKFGSLCKQTWKKDLKEGFDECWRVLKDKGILIFKWNAVHISFNDVLALFPVKPLFGHKTAKHGRTIWWCFMKIPEEVRIS